jgi:hypothetical protein
MTVQIENLERLFSDFVSFLNGKNETFKNFKSSAFLEEEENYKYAVYEQAKESLQQQSWEESQIGSGKILEIVKAAIKARVIYNYQFHENNLIDWRKRDDFSKLPVSKTLERTLFDFYKNKIKAQEAFEEFLALRLPYQLIAYLFFIKDKDQYLPITQERFDEAFEKIGIPDFKTTFNSSWVNYQEYIDIIKQVKSFLKWKDPNVSLLDAHSFLYILVSQMKTESFPFSAADKITRNEPLYNVNNNEENDILSGTTIKPEDPIAIYEDENLTEEISEEVEDQLFEGAPKPRIVNAYERSLEARMKCIKHWKAVCSVCGLDFEEKYGEIGKGFIHVHHLTPMALGYRQVDYINDLRPVCPNCHAMLHRHRPPDDPLSIEELKSRILVAEMP